MTLRTTLLTALALLTLASTASAAEIARYRVTIEADDGRYLIADNDSARGMSADSTDPTGSREHFTLIERPDGNFNLLGYHGHFVAVKRDYVNGSQPVRADKALAGHWERLFPEGGELAFDSPRQIGTWHGTNLRQHGDDLDAYFAWDAGPENDFVVRKEGFAARFLNTNGHTTRADGSVDYVGDVEVPASNGQSMVLANAQVNYRRDMWGAFTRFSGTSDAPLFDVDGLAAELGDLAGEDTEFDLLSPSSSWPTSVPRGDQYLRIYNTNAASWGPIDIAPTGWGKRAMLFDHNDGTVHLRGQIDLGSGADVAWMAVGAATLCDIDFERGGVIVDDHAVEANINMCLTIEDAPLAQAQGTDWIGSLHVEDDATLTFEQDGEQYVFTMLDAEIDLDRASADLRVDGDLTGTTTLPWGLVVADAQATVRTAVHPGRTDLVIDIADAALGTTLDAQAWRFSGHLAVRGYSSGTEVVLHGQLEGGGLAGIEVARTYGGQQSSSAGPLRSAVTLVAQDRCTSWNGHEFVERRVEVEVEFDVSEAAGGLVATQLSAKCYVSSAFDAYLVNYTQSSGRVVPVLETIDDNTGYNRSEAGLGIWSQIVLD